MWAALIPVLLSLLEQIIPSLGPLIVALINNLTVKLENPDTVVMVTDQIVQGIEANADNAAKTGDEKYQMAYDALKVSQPNISTSMANALIELAVQRFKDKPSA